MDFSEAERNGFIQAYASFRQWEYEEGLVRDLVATEDDLKRQATTLLKGCQQHYRAQITRIAGISIAVDVTRIEEFKRRAWSLVDYKDSKDFNAAANALQKDFPAIKPWLEWWRRPNNARVLFESHRIMPEALWRALPDTTNAEESMHNKIYQGIGNKHTLMDGLTRLRLFVDLLANQSDSAKSEFRHFFRGVR